MDNIYIVYLIDIKELSFDDMKKNFECYKIKYNKPNFSFQRFVELMEDWNKYPYHFTVDPQGYYTDYEEAQRIVESNSCDINESGSFPYVVIASMPTNCIYPCCFSDRVFTLFKYDKENNCYNKISWDTWKLNHLLKFAECGGM